MWACYVVALVPAVLGALLWLGSRRITFREWMKGAVLGFVVAAGFHAYTVKTLTLDYEVWSGRVVRVEHRPACQVDVGDETEFVDEHWVAAVDFGEEQQAFDISREEYDDLGARFGGEVSLEPAREYDPTDDDYRVEVIRDARDVMVPAHTFRLFENRAAVDSIVHAYRDPPDDLPLHEYPLGMTAGDVRMFLLADATVRFAAGGRVEHELQLFDWRRSGRLLGRAAEDFPIEGWDALCAELGPEVGVNLIAIGFDGDSSLAAAQEAKWRGGKKNDLVLCYGPPTADGTPAWTYCFGWADDPLVLRDLESLLRASRPGAALLPAIGDEVRANYRRRTWPELDLMRIAAPPGALTRLLLIMLGVQGLYWAVALLNRTRRGAADAVERAEVAAERERARAKREEAAERRRVAQALGHVDLDDVDALRRELGGKHEYEACLALTRVRDPRAATALAVALASSRFRVREMAGRWLDEHHSDPGVSAAVRDAVPELMARTAHRHPEVRREARRVLELVEPEWTLRPEVRGEVEAWVAALPEGGAAVEDALAARGAPAVDVLLASLADPASSPAARVAALRALGATGDPRALPPILEVLEAAVAAGEDRWLARDDDLRVAAVEGLARFGSGLAAHPEAARVQAALRAALEGFERARRSGCGVATKDALLALSWLRDPADLPALTARLDSQNPDLRVAAVEGIGNLGAAEGSAPILSRLDAASGDLLFAAIRALGRIGGDALVAPLVRQFSLRAGQGTLVLENIVHVLFPIGGPEVEALLARAAEDPHCGIDDLAQLRLRQLRAGFVPPGFDPSAARVATSADPARSSSP